MIEHTGAHILQSYLIAVGYGVAPGTPGALWPIFRNLMPENPNNALSVGDQEGVTEGRVQRTGETIEHPGVQLRIRATQSDEGTRKGILVYPIWDAVKNTVVMIGLKSYTITSLNRTSPVLSLGQEEGGSRYLFTVNGILTYKETP